MTNFNLPALTSTYTNFINELKARDNEVASLFSANGITQGNYPVRAIRWNTGGFFQRRNAGNTDWEALEGSGGTHKFVNLEAGNITATSALSGSQLSVTNDCVAGRYEVNGGTKGSNGFYLATTNEIRFTTDGNDRLTIQSNGTVGINNVDPSFTLDVNGTFRVVNGSNDSQIELGHGGSGNRNAIIDFVGDDTYTDYGFRIWRGNQGANSGTLLLHRGVGNLAIQTQEVSNLLLSTQSTTRMCVRGNGLVGIGNFESPEANLHFYLNSVESNVIRFENSEGNAYIRADNNKFYFDSDQHFIRNAAGTHTFLDLSTTLLTLNGNSKVVGNLEVTGTINATINGITSSANDINIDERNNSAEYQVTFSDTNGTGYQRQFIDSDDTHFKYNPATATLTGLNINCTNLTATGSVSVTASNSNQLSGKVLSASGNRHDVIASIGGDGVMEVGRYIDFHVTDNDTSDLGGGRIEGNGTDFLFTKSLLPNTGNSLNLGSANNRWQIIYVNDMNFSNKGGQNSVDGTWGDWTLQEGEKDVYMLNNRSGKKYKINMTEVDM